MTSSTEGDIEFLRPPVAHRADAAAAHLRASGMHRDIHLPSSGQLPATDAPGVHTGDDRLILLLDATGSIVHSHGTLADVSPSAAELAGRPLDDLLDAANVSPSGISELLAAARAGDAVTFAGTLAATERDAVPVRCRADWCAATASFAVVIEAEPAADSHTLPLAASGESGPCDALCDSHQHLRDILDNSSAVVFLKDLDGRYQFVNRRFEELFHVRLAELLGRTDFEIFPQDMAEAFRRNDLAVIERGTTLNVQEVAPHEDGLHTYISVKFPLRDEAGEIRAMAGISTDITDMVRQEREVERLNNRLSLILNSVSDGIFGVDADGRLTFVNQAAEKMLGWSSADLAGESFDRVFGESSGSADGGANVVAETLAAGPPRGPQTAAFLRRSGERIPVEFVCNPARAGKAVVGAVVTFRDLRDLQARIRSEEELRTAQVVQQQLYPAHPPEFEEFDIAGAAFPATQACGDYFDFIPCDAAGTILAVGDVTGHGLGSALQMVETRAYLRTMIGRMPDLSEAIFNLNQFLVEDTPDGSFVSLFTAHLDPRTRALRYVGAGHDAWLMRADGRCEHLKSTGILLGLLADAPMPVGPEQTLEVGDLLLIVTDGLIEAMSPANEVFGTERMLEVVDRHRDRPSGEIIAALKHAVGLFAADRPIRDDITIVVARSV